MSQPQLMATRRRSMGPGFHKGSIIRALLEMDPAEADLLDLSGKPHIPTPHHRIQNKQTIEQRFTLGSKIGEGAFGKVKLVTETLTGKVYAMKVMEKRIGNAKASEQMDREILIMKKLNHPHIIKIKEVFETSEKYYLIMEYCSGGDLFRLIKRGISEKDVQLIVKSLVEAVAYLHDHGIVHRDLKPKNVLFADVLSLDIRLADFGLVTFTEGCAMIDSTAGTPFYMAPEVTRGSSYSQQCDIWSLGIIAYIGLVGATKRVEQMLTQMKEEGRITFPSTLWDQVSPIALDATQRMLQWDPAERITAKELFEHPWIQVDNRNLAISTDLQRTPSNLNPTLPSPTGTAHRTVLRMMRAYNAERRFRRVILAVYSAVTWLSIYRQNGSSSSNHSGETPAQLSSRSTSNRSSDKSLSRNQRQ